MKRLFLIGITVTSMLAAGCGENQTSQTVDRVPPPANPVVAPVAQPAGTTPVVARAAEGGTISSPIPPAGAQWTWFCASFHDPEHVLRSNQAKQDLLKQSHLSDWYIVHHEDESMLYYGYYTAPGSPKAKADKQAIDRLVGPNGDRAFATCQFVPLSSPDPTAPKEWDLTSTPQDMYWSVQVGAFQGLADRKQRAVQAVRWAREAGYEAYYYHGDSISSVCIGAWPRTAVHQQAVGAVAHNDNPDVPVLVVGGKLPDGTVPNIHDEQGRPVPVIAPELQIDDPTLAKVISEFPEHAVNGAVMVSKDKNGNPVPSQSFLVIIPHDKKSRDVDDPDAPHTAGPTAVPADGTDSTLGKLRTIGDH
jgi:cell division septation protein DedD